MRSLFTILVFLVSTFSFAQSDLVKTIDVNNDVDVVLVYEQVVREGYGNQQIYKELAVAQYFRNNYSEAKIWFERLFELEPLSDETLSFRYLQTLKALKLDLASNQYLNK